MEERKSFYIGVNYVERLRVRGYMGEIVKVTA